MTIEDIALMKNKMYFGLVGTPKKDQRFVRFTTIMRSFALSPFQYHNALPETQMQYHLIDKNLSKSE